MTQSNNSLKYGNKKTKYTLVRSDRTTLEIAVLPDKSVVLNAPKKIGEEKIQKKI